MPSTRVSKETRMSTIVIRMISAIIVLANSNATVALGQIGYARVIHQKWTEREERFQNMKINFRITESFSKMSLAEEPFLPKGKIKGDVVLENRLSFHFHDGKVSVTQSGDQLYDGKSIKVAAKKRHLFSEDEHRFFGGSGNYFQGAISTVSMNDINSVTLGSLRPLWASFHTAKWFRYRHAFPNQMVIEKRNVVVDGEKCFQLSVPKRNRDYTTTAFAAPDKDFAIRRVIVRRKSKPYFDMVLRYDQPNSTEWIVKKWVITNYHDSGTLRSTTKGIVHSTHFNQEVGPMDFQLEFPEGVQFSDSRKGIGGRIKYFVSLGGGKHEEIDQSEFGRRKKKN